MVKESRVLKALEAGGGERGKVEAKVGNLNEELPPSPARLELAVKRLASMSLSLTVIGGESYANKMPVY